MLDSLCSTACVASTATLVANLNTSCRADRYLSHTSNMTFAEFGELIAYRTSQLCLKNTGANTNYCHLAWSTSVSACFRSHVPFGTGLTSPQLGYSLLGHQDVAVCTAQMGLQVTRGQGNPPSPDTVERHGSGHTGLAVQPSRKRHFRAQRHLARPKQSPRQRSTAQRWLE